MATSLSRASPEDVVAAVDINRVAGHCTSVGAGEENAGGADLGDRDQPARRRALRHPRHQRVEIGDARGGAGGERAWADSVHADALGAELDGEVAHRRFECGLDRPHDSVILDDLVRAMVAHGEDRSAADHQLLGAARQIEKRPARYIHRRQKAVARAVGDAPLQRFSRGEGDRVDENVEASPFRRDRLEQRIDLGRVPHFERQEERRLDRRRQRLDIRARPVVEIGHGDLGARPMHRLGAPPGDRSVVRYANDQCLLPFQDRGMDLRRHACTPHRIAAPAFRRRASATRLATAQDASRVTTESARLVRMIGTRAPSTTPAASAPARKDRLLASMLPASRSGTTRTFARPATGETMCLIAAASSLIALSSANGPSRIAPVIWPRSAILHNAAASTVDGTLGLTVSIADRIATRTSSNRSAWPRSIAFCTMSTLASRSGAMFTAASVTISGSLWPGTSITKQWLMRRAVRMPPSRATTAPISSSVCRLPFIKASALPSRTSSTAFAAESWLCADSLSGKPDMSSSARSATSRTRSGGPTRIGAIRPSLAASTAPLSETSSQGCATAVVTGGSCLAARRSRS